MLSISATHDAMRKNIISCCWQSETRTKNINRLEYEGRASVDEVLASLLPDLLEALGAAQAFVAVYHSGKKKRGKCFEVVATHPEMELKESLLPWSKHLGDVLSDGRARVVEPFEDFPRKLIHGLEVFNATTAVLVRMQIGTESSNRWGL